MSPLRLIAALLPEAVALVLVLVVALWTAGNPALGFLCGTAIGVLYFCWERS